VKRNKLNPAPVPVEEFEQARANARMVRQQLFRGEQQVAIPVSREQRREPVDEPQPPNGP
jgi:hypothetical protein